MSIAARSAVRIRFYHFLSLKFKCVMQQPLLSKVTKLEY